MILGKIFTLLLLFQGCDRADCMKNYYTTHKQEILAIRGYAESLNKKYNYKDMSILKIGEELQLGFMHEESCGVTMYLKLDDLSIDLELDTDECNQQVINQCQTMYNDPDLQAILRSFMSIKPEAITISPYDVFIALGRPLKSPNMNLDGGITMTYNKPLKGNSRVTSEIDTYVYLNDDLVD